MRYSMFNGLAQDSAIRLCQWQATLGVHQLWSQATVLAIFLDYEG